MTLEIIKYSEQISTIPIRGKIILAQQTDEQIVLYQAYKKEIADDACAHQKLGGSHFSYRRMSWIKPNFLWMMYRCGWAEKENQENVLAIWIKKSDFEHILEHAVHSSFQENIYQSIDDWKDALEKKDVRLQWDPDHDPFGIKQERRAIQLGLKGKMLSTFGEEMIQKIENITDFVKAQKQFIDKKETAHLMVPVEQLYRTTNEKLNEKLGIE